MDINSLSQSLTAKSELEPVSDLLKQLRAAGSVEAEVIKLLPGKLLLASRLGEILTSNTLNYKPGDRLMLRLDESGRQPVLKAAPPPIKPLRLEARSYPQLAREIPLDQAIVARVTRIGVRQTEIQLPRRMLEIPRLPDMNRDQLLVVRRDGQTIEIVPLEHKRIYKAILQQLIPRQAENRVSSLSRLVSLLLPEVNRSPPKATPAKTDVEARLPSAASTAKIPMAAREPTRVGSAAWNTRGPAASANTEPVKQTNRTRPSATQLLAGTRSMTPVQDRRHSGALVEITRPAADKPARQRLSIKANLTKPPAQAPRGPILEQPLNSKQTTTRLTTAVQDASGAKTVLTASTTDQGPGRPSAPVSTSTPLPQPAANSSPTRLPVNPLSSGLPSPSHAPASQAPPGDPNARPQTTAPRINTAATTSNEIQSVAAQPTTKPNSLQILLQGVANFSNIDSRHIRQWFEFAGVISPPKTVDADAVPPNPFRILQSLRDPEVFTRELIQSIQHKTTQSAEREAAATNATTQENWTLQIREALKLIEQSLSQNLLQRATIGLQQETQQPLNFSFALPVLEDEQVKSLYIELAQRNQSPQPENQSWDIRVSFDLAGLGPITCHIVLEGITVAASFYSERAATRGSIEQALPQLRQQLIGAGFQAGDFHSFVGKPDSGNASAVTAFTEALLDVEV